MMRRSVHSIVEILDQFHQRATYGAVAALADKPAQSVMQGLPRDTRHCWVVNKRTGEPTDYDPQQKHSALREKLEILATEERLAAWLDNPQ